MALGVGCDDRAGDGAPCRDRGILLVRQWDPNLYAFFTPASVLYAANFRAGPYFSDLQDSVSGEDAMDILYIGLIVGFVAVSIGLVYYFERLRRPQ